MIAWIEVPYPDPGPRNIGYRGKERIDVSAVVRIAKQQPNGSGRDRENGADRSLRTVTLRDHAGPLRRDVDLVGMNARRMPDHDADRIGRPADADGVIGPDLADFRWALTLEIILVGIESLRDDAIDIGAWTAATTHAQSYTRATQ